MKIYFKGKRANKVSAHKVLKTTLNSRHPAKQKLQTQQAQYQQEPKHKQIQQHTHYPTYSKLKFKKKISAA